MKRRGSRELREAFSFRGEKERNVTNESLMINHPLETMTVEKIKITVIALNCRLSFRHHKHLMTNIKGWR